MSEDIPYATPYPWENPSMEDSQKYINKALRKKRFVGSGFAALRNSSSSTAMGDVAKNLLMNLLQQHSIDIDEGSDVERDVDELYRGALSRLDRKALQQGTTEEVILEQARNGRLSLFLSILKAIEDGETPITTKNLLRNCCMTLRPGDLPGSLDAKEMILAALHFLSSHFESKSDQLLSLPLIRSVQDASDLEKRSYEKVGEWKLVNLKAKLLRTEQVFVTSPSTWKWLKRESFCPRLSQKDETSFFLKGSIPASASAKKVKGETSRKRKISSASSPATPAPRSSSPGNDTALDATPVVEATIVAEGSPTNSIE